MPDEELLAQFYQRQDYFQSQGDFGYSDYEAKRGFYLSLFREYLQILNRHGSPGRLLDLGSGNGDFLMLAREAGWEAYGVEISEPCLREAERRSGVRVYSSLRLLPEKKEFFDLITMWEFIEHLPSPARVFGEILPLLRPGGLVALTTPNTRNLTALRSPSLWTEFKPPEHLQFFDFETMGRFLSGPCHLQLIEVKGIHRDLRLASARWVEWVLEWASRVRDRHNQRGDALWWVYAVLVRLLKEAPRAVSLSLHLLDPQLVSTGIFVLARK